MDFKSAREERELTLKQVSVLAGYSIPTINALELEGRGSERLKEKLLAIYRLKENDPDRGVSLHEVSTESDLQIWKRRAQVAEKELADLRGGLRKLLEPSSKPLSEAQRILKHAGDKFDREHPSS